MGAGYSHSAVPLLGGLIGLTDAKLSMHITSLCLAHIYLARAKFGRFSIK